MAHSSPLRPTARLAAAAALGAFCAASAAPALAQEDESRFQIERVGEDVLRLDRETGEVELCAQSTPTFVCRTVVPAAPPPEPGEAGTPASGEILAENQSLRLENARLKRRLAMIAALVSDAEADEVSTSSLIPKETRQNIDEAFDVTSYAVRRFRDLVKTLTDEPAPN